MVLKASTETLPYWKRRRAAGICKLCPNPCGEYVHCYECRLFQARKSRALTHPEGMECGVGIRIKP